MNPDAEKIRKDLEARLYEAETCYSMGMVEESRAIYEELLGGRQELDERIAAKIRNRVAALKKETGIKDRPQGQGLSPRDIQLIRGTLSGGATEKSLAERAAAFVELGLFKDALKEYEKILNAGHADPKTVQGILKCLAKIYPIQKIGEQIKNLVGRMPAGDSQKKSATLYLFGTAIEKQGIQDLALDLFRAALQLNPGDVKTRRKYESFMAGRATGSRYDYLISKKLINAEQLQGALGISRSRGKSVETILIEQFKISTEDIGRSLSLYYGCPFKRFDPRMTVPYEIIRNMKKSFLLNDLWVPISWGKSGIDILMEDPKDIRKTDHIRALIKTRKIILHVGIKEDIEKYIRHFFKKQVQSSMAQSIDEQDFLLDIDFEEEEEDEEQVEGLDESASQVVKLVDQVLVKAFRDNASDIHIEPSPISKKTTVRFRLDGVCQEYVTVPNSMARGILSRLKIMANLDIAERRLPQDGKIKFHRKGIPPFELRMATLPTAGGYEDAVLRILAKAGAMAIDEMKLSERNLAILRKIITRPYGLILAVGPTGSGKTTTLHAALGHINKPGVKIWTAEDPVEISQEGLRQVEVKPKIGLDFARVMRAFLRADPDVIMIGEMRDRETAAIGVEASLTGHLVFSTLHTNSAPETITRLLDMGLNALNFSDAFLGVLAQRLVRRLCRNCCKPYHPSQEEFQELVDQFGADRFKGTGIQYSRDLTLYRAAGCEQCSGSGYKGRMGIHELMEGTPAIKKLIKKQAMTEEIFAQASKEGMNTLKQDGILKVFQGLTDFDEVRRVCIE